MSEEEKEAIDEIKKDDEYLNILQDIKENKYNMYNVAKLMKDTTNGDYTEYEIAESIVYFVKLVEKKQKEIDKQNKVIDEIIDLLQDNLNFSPLNGLNKQELKQYFIRKVEENGENSNKRQTNSND